jgi:iron complex outermembrane receptor protein
VSVLLSQDLPENWQVSCGYYRVGAMHVMSGGDSLPVTERVDLRLAKRFRLGSTSAEAALIVQNATGGTPVFELTDVSRRTSWLNIRMEY